MVPASVDQITAVSAVPATAAVKRMVPPPMMATAAGSIDTSTPEAAVPCGPPWFELRPQVTEIAAHSAAHPARHLARIRRPQAQVRKRFVGVSLLEGVFAAAYLREGEGMQHGCARARLTSWWRRS